MARLNVLLLICLALPAVILITSHDGIAMTTAEEVAEDEVDNDEMEIDSEDETVRVDEDDEYDDGIPRPSPFCDVTILFVKPLVTDASAVVLPSGKVVEFVVGFTNKGGEEFLVQSTEATFRYPQDFTYVIQNFSAIAYNKVVLPRNQASIYYSFMVADAFSSRPFRLQVDVKYSDKSGRQYANAVFNETINVVEMDEGLDGETFFLYVFLAAFCVLILVAGQQLLSVGFGKRRRGGGRSQPGPERGTNDNGAVDYDWLPESTLKSATTPKSSPRQSPRLRKNRA